jgi:hypothetical protein
MSLDYCVTYVPGLYQHALQLTKELLIVRAPRALLWNPLQLNWRVSAQRENLIDVAVDSAALHLCALKPSASLVRRPIFALASLDHRAMCAAALLSR